MARPRTGSFRHEGHTLVYDEFGSGRRTVVLLHGLLLSRRMHEQFARSLAEQGNRVVTLDLLGHGDSDRPPEMWRYSMPVFGEQTIALLDHLEVDRAVLMGTSLGANVSLEAALRAPDRLRGMVVEMPVLDNALLACAIVFGPMLVGLTLGAPLARAVSRATSLIPPTTPLLDVGLDALRQDPKPSASVLQGLFFGRTAPPREKRRMIQTKSLVIGHTRDPIHPFSDSGMLVRELPNGRLLEANSILELRLTPGRLTREISRFIDDCYAPARRRRRLASARASRDGGRRRRTRA